MAYLDLRNTAPYEYQMDSGDDWLPTEEPGLHAWYRNLVDISPHAYSEADVLSAIFGHDPIDIANGGLTLGGQLVT